MVESNDLIYFHVIQPTKVGYVFKTRPAQDFGDLFVSYLRMENFFHTYNSWACHEEVKQGGGGGGGVILYLLTIQNVLMGGGRQIKFD